MINWNIFKLRTSGKFTIPLLTWRFSCLFDNCVKSVDYEDITFHTIVNPEDIYVPFDDSRNIVHTLLLLIRALPLYGNELILITIIFGIFGTWSEYIAAMISPQLTYSLFGDHLILWNLNLLIIIHFYLRVILVERVHCSHFFGRDE